MRRFDDFAGFGLDLFQMALTLKAFGVDFSDVLSAGRPGGKPAVFGADFQSADGDGWVAALPRTERLFFIRYFLFNISSER